MYLDVEPQVTISNDTQGFARPEVFRAARLRRLRKNSLGQVLRAEAQRLEDQDATKGSDAA